MKSDTAASNQQIRIDVSRSIRWRGLQGRMTFSYVLVTIIAAFLLELLLLVFMTFVIGAAYNTVLFPQLAMQVARQYAFVAALQANRSSLNPQSTFLPGQPDSLLPMPDEGTTLLPKAVDTTIPYTSTLVPETQPLTVGLLIAPNGEILTSSYPDRFPNQTPAAARLPNQMSAITNASRNGTAASDTEMGPAGLTAWVVVPIWGKERDPIGALYLQTPVRGPDGQLTDHPPELSKVLLLVLLSALALSMLISPIGGLFGLLTTRGLIRRIRQLVAATTAFAQGHYEQRVLVTRKDEIGQLEEHLNQMAEQLAESIQSRQDLAEQNARLAERARISRELHDAISQDLFSLRMLVGGIQRALPADSPLTLQIAALQDMATTMIREMRALLLELRPTQLEHLGLVEALEDLAAAYRTRLGITVSTALRPVLLSAQAEQALLRITQEALSNAARHADATTITLDLTSQEQAAKLTITDNGQGFEPGTGETQHGLGLRSMRERVQELGGFFVLESAPGQGTRVLVSLPQEPEPDGLTGAKP